ncbi:serine/threonine-protein kinase [Myxococcota bacterium]|nr:serine/threonine-protein kinase [Myxococcota bacterium]
MKSQLPRAPAQTPLNPGQSAPAFSIAEDEVGQAWPTAQTLFDAPPEGRYTLGNPLGLGGMGQVWVAEDGVLRRQVALKELSPTLRESASAEASLAWEAWITAQLDHPGIVSVHDAGRRRDGAAFYTMRLIRGRSLAAAIAAKEPLPRLVRHFIDACDAMAYAHSAGVIHRDLKPSNVMVGEFGETQVVDWGLALPTGPGAGASAPGVAPPPSRGVLGTPAYMSPEQARGEPADARSDVWGLGAILYELLSGSPPYAGQDSSTLLDQVRAGAPPPLRLAHPELPPELCAIAERAMMHSPDRRYPSARALAEDVARWFEGRRVEAYDYSPKDLLLRFWRAWRAHVVVITLALLAVGVSLALGLARASEERDNALAAEAEAEASRARSDSSLAQALVERAQAALMTGDRAQAELHAAASLRLADSPEARGVLAAFAAAPRPRHLGALALPSCHRVGIGRDGVEILCAEDERVRLLNAHTLAERWSVPLSAATEVAIHERTVVVQRAVGLYVLSRETGETLEEWPTSLAKNLLAVGPGKIVSYKHNTQLVLSGQTATILANPLSCEGTKIAALTIGPEGQIASMCNDGRLWLEGDMAPIMTPFSAGSEAQSMTFTPDGSGLVVGTHRGVVTLYSLTERRALHSSSLGVPSSIEALRVSPDGALLAALTARGEVSLWSLVNGEPISTLPGRGHRALEFIGPTTLAVANDQLHTWALPTRVPVLRHQLPVGLSGVAVSSDGRSLALSAAEGLVRVFPRSWGDDGAVKGVHGVDLPSLGSTVVKSVAFSSDGGTLAIGAMAMGNPRIAQAEDWGRALGAGALDSVRRLLYLADGRLLMAGYIPALWLAAPPYDSLITVPLGVTIEDLGASADGVWVLLVDDHGQAWRGRGSAIADMLLVVARPGLIAGDIHADGRLVLLGLEDAVEVWDAVAGRRLHRWPAHNVRDVALSPDGRFAAAGLVDGQTWVWSTDDGALRAALRGHTDRVAGLEWGPDGDWLITGSWDRSARIWWLKQLNEAPDTLAEAVAADWGISLRREVEPNPGVPTKFFE